MCAAATSSYTGVLAPPPLGFLYMGTSEYPPPGPSCAWGPPRFGEFGMGWIGLNALMISDGALGLCMRGPPCSHHATSTLCCSTSPPLITHAGCLDLSSGEVLLHANKTQNRLVTDRTRLRIRLYIHTPYTHMRMYPCMYEP